MPYRPKILDFLRTASGTAADAALAEGLALVGPDYQPELFDVLMSRGSEEAFRSIPGVFHRLSPTIQNRVVSSAARLSGALREGVRDPQGQTRSNVIAIVRRSGNPRLAYIPAMAVNDASTSVRPDAAATLRDLTDAHCRNHAETVEHLRDATEPHCDVQRAIVKTLTLLGEERRYLKTALLDALRTYESHLRTEVLEAAMFLADELEPDLCDQNARRRGVLTHAMLEVFASSPSRRLVPFAYVALRHPEMRHRVVMTLARCRDEAFFVEFIRWHWLGRDPSIRKALQAVRSLDWLDHSADVAFRLPNDAAAAMPAWLAPLGVSIEQKTAVLRDLLLVDDADVNRAAVWALVNLRTADSTRLLRTALDHERPELRRIARRELDRRTGTGRPVARPQAADRSGGGQQGSRPMDVGQAFDELWRSFDQLDPVSAKIAGAGAPAQSVQVAARIREKLLSRNVPDRLRALRMITVLGLADRVRDELFALAHDASDQVRAADMTALGHVGDATSRRIVERALDDESPAVQAAAIEALDFMAPDHGTDLLLPKSESDSAAVRAAAIRALLRRRVAAAAANLAHMLCDPRSEHRTAALWLADRLHLAAIAPRIADVANSDPDPQVVRVARHVYRRLTRIAAATPAGADHRAEAAT